DAWVWHKRRTDIKKFFRQVFNSGIARINLYKKYPESLKLVHLLPAVFTLGVCLLVLTSAVGRVLMAHVGDMEWYWLAAVPWLPIIFFALVILLDSTIRNKSLKIGFYSIVTAFVQLMGYGFGFLSAWWKRCVCKKDEFSAFNETFYK
ncbi:MAG: glycosyl transferase family 2, partial [Prevotellaceae bacterium]|nr:glycosyl transferase family 2 [Prevotellaceae bacterium]